MKIQFNLFKVNLKFLITITLTLLFINCGTIDNFDSDAFTLFGNENKKGSTEFRRYSNKKLNLPPLIEFYLDNEDVESVRFNINLNKICDYTKLPYKTTELKLWDSSPVISPSTRVICLMGTAKLSAKSIDKITEFVANGGTLFLPISSEDSRINFLIGFKPEAEGLTDIKSKGFNFKIPILVNLLGAKINEKVMHYGFAKENFSSSIKILATAINNPTFPTIVENKVGKGYVFLYNTRKALEKRDRGFLFTGILKGLEGIPYPIANTSTIFLDDFPCPLFDIKNEPIASELNLTSTDFIKKVWWPDMRKLAKKYNISYSAMLTFDYKNRVVPPFLFDQWDNHKIRTNKKVEPLSDWFVYELSKNGHELAFHGYNHVELKKDLWDNQEFIGMAIKSVQKKWEINNFGKLPTTYVPPSNHIDNLGINELKAAMPSLKYLCSAYNGYTVDGGNREFDFDPYNKDFFDFPRISSGYYLTSDQEYEQQSAYLFTGIWTHFVHPDDVYQISSQKNDSQGDFDYRNALNLGWYTTKGKKIGMLSEFDKYLKNKVTLLPQIRFLNADEAANIVLDWRASSFNHKSKDGIYTVEELNPEKSISGNQYWFLYVSTPNCQKMETEMQKQKVRFSKAPYLEGYLYTVFTTVSKLSVPDLKYQKEETIPPISEEYSNVKKEILVYESKVKQFRLDEKYGVDDSDQKLKLAIETLKQKMVTEEKIDYDTWNKYTKFMLWQDNGVEVWKLLENHCLKYPITENIMYSKELNKLVEYPNDQIKEKWLSAQMLITPNDAALLNNYIASFYTPENQNKIKTALINLLKIDSGFDTYFQYIQYLLAYDPKTALTELNKVEPSIKYKNLATDITWLYADNKEFKKAYDWSAFSSEIDFVTRMSWLIELKAYALLETEYKKYIQKNGNDYKALSILSTINHEIGKFKDGWILANSLPESTEKENLKALFNKDVLYIDEKLQQDLVNNYPSFFYPEVKNQLIKTNRIENGNFVTFNTFLESNKQDASAFKNILSYNRFDAKKNLHSLGFTFSKMYKINYDIVDKDNVTHTLYGLQYQFKNPKSYDKLQYWSRIRGEYSDLDKLFFQFGLGVNFSVNKRYTSAEFKIFPAETGAAHSKSIYRFQANLYQDAYFFGVLNASLSLEGNYFNRSISKTVAKTSDNYEGSATIKISLNNGVEQKSKFLPFIEASYLKSSIGAATVNPNTGYPYWIIPQRFYAGGGLGWKYGKSDSNFSSRVEAAWFYDDYSDEFKRFIGEMAFQIFDYTAITTTFEIYVQSKFYSNSLQFGVKHNFKKRQKK